MNKYLLAYAAGVITAPAWFYIFRKPLAKTLAPIVAPIMASDEMDRPLYEMMLARNDFKDQMKTAEK